MNALLSSALLKQGLRGRGPKAGSCVRRAVGAGSRWELGKCSSDFCHLKSSTLFSSYSDPLCPLSSPPPWFLSFSPPCYSFLFLLFLFHFPHYLLLSSQSKYSLEIQFWYLFIKGSIFTSLATYHHMKQLFLRAKKKKKKKVLNKGLETEIGKDS